MSGKLRKKQIFRIKIFCSGCNALLYKYNKEGPGNLVKCFVDGITENNTTKACTCPKCEKVFAREDLLRGRPIHRLIKGTFFKRGNTGKK